ncbi:hypothetical protein KSS87_007547, partial [Heliosperma pusillum]
PNILGSTNRFAYTNHQLFKNILTLDQADKSCKSTTAPLAGARKDDIANRTNVCLNSSAVNPLPRRLFLTTESGIGSLLLTMLYLFTP